MCNNTVPWKHPPPLALCSHLLQILKPLPHVLRERNLWMAPLNQFQNGSNFGWLGPAFSLPLLRLKLFEMTMGLFCVGDLGSFGGGLLRLRRLLADELGWRSPRVLGFWGGVLNIEEDFAMSCAEKFIDLESIEAGDLDLDEIGEVE